MPIFLAVMVRLAQIFCLGCLISGWTFVRAAPLKKGTLLTITVGAIGYPEGTCFGSYLRFLNDAITCYPLGPGSDGGLVVGKNQASGGQEAATRGFQSQRGELSSAFSRLGYATLATAPMQGINGGEANMGAAANRFDDVSCSASACRGKVEINALHQAYKGQVIAGGCAHADCTSTGGSGVKSWVVNADRSYKLDASWGKTEIHLEGTIVAPGTTQPVASAINLHARAGEKVQWQPQISYLGEGKVSCTLLPSRYAFYGTMTLATDCSRGVYSAPNPLFSGRECRQYQVFDGNNWSAPVDVCVQVEPSLKNKKSIKFEFNARPNGQGS